MKDKKALFLAIASSFCFGTGFTLAKPAVAHFPPLMMMLFAYGFIAVATLMTVRRPAVNSSDGVRGQAPRGPGWVGARKAKAPEALVFRGLGWLQGLDSNQR